MKRVSRTSKYPAPATGGALLACWLWAGPLFAGDPIVFVRPIKPAGSTQLPAKKVDEQIAAALDSLQAPNPIDGPMTSPAFERPRSGGGGLSRRAELARKEKQNWLWYDEGDLQDQETDDRALGGKFEVEADDKLPGERDTRRSGLRQSASERRTEEREARVPMHLLSPRVRQQLQAEAMITRRQAGNHVDEEGPSQVGSGLEVEAARKIDLSRLLAPAAQSSSLSDVRELVGGPERGGPRRGIGPSSVDLGLGGGSEALGGLSPMRLGPELKEPRYGASFLDRTTDPEVRSSPPVGLGGPQQSFGSFPSFRDNTSIPSAIPAAPERAGPRPLESLDYSPPRRGGLLGR